MAEQVLTLRERARLGLFRILESSRESLSDAAWFESIEEELFSAMNEAAAAQRGTLETGVELVIMMSESESHARESHERERPSHHRESKPS